MRPHCWQVAVGTVRSTPMITARRGVMIQRDGDTWLFRHNAPSSNAAHDWGHDRIDRSLRQGYYKWLLREILESQPTTDAIPIPVKSRSSRWCQDSLEVLLFCLVVVVLTEDKVKHSVRTVLNLPVTAYWRRKIAGVPIQRYRWRILARKAAAEREDQRTGILGFCSSSAVAWH